MTGPAPHPGDDAGEKLPDGIRVSLDTARRRLGDLRERLSANERRILALEGRATRHDPSWSHTVGTADALIAAVAALEITSMQAGTSPVVDGPLAEVMTRTGLTSDDIERFAAAEGPARTGAINNLQGHLGEQYALELINSGMIPVPEGYVARLADSPNQPAWDLELIDPDGGPVVHAQVKISDTAATIREHFARYPDVSVVYANSEAAAALSDDGLVTVIGRGADFPAGTGRTVVDMGVSHGNVRDGVAGLLEAGAGEPLLQKILTDVPLISLLLIAGRAAGSYLGTDEAGSQILRTAGRRARDVLVANSLGHATTAATSEPLTGSITAAAYLVGGNAVRAARGDITRATDRFVSTRTALGQFSPAV
ncbi:MAG: hypothetical protein ACKOFF_04220 [Acidimicrobiales bacterium]